MQQSEHTALVTGASAGIGAAFAGHLASQGYSLLLVARRAERLEALAGALSSQHGVTCDVFAADLTAPDAPEAIMAHAANRQLTIDVLINNAGLSGKDSFAGTPWPKHAADIQLMVTALTELCHRTLPGMLERNWGRIINLSSIAAFAPPGASLLYTGIKSYVLGISQSLDMELKPHGIHVTALCPGFTRSEFHDAMGTREEADNLPGILWQDADEVVQEGWDAVMKGRPVCIPGRVNKVMAGSMSRLPLSVQYLIGKNLNPFA